MEILNVDWLSNNEIYIYIYIIYNYCFGQSDVDLWYRMIGFFKFLVDITDIADVVCLLFLLFIIRFCFAFLIKPLIFCSQSILWLVISHKKVLSLRIYGSMSEVFLRKFLRSNIYFISKNYAVRKNSETSMKTIHTETVFSWPSQYVRGVASTITST